MPGQTPGAHCTWNCDSSSFKEPGDPGRLKSCRKLVDDFWVGEVRIKGLWNGNSNTCLFPRSSLESHLHESTVAAPPSLGCVP